MQYLIAERSCYHHGCGERERDGGEGQRRHPQPSRCPKSNFGSPSILAIAIVFFILRSPNACLTENFSGTELSRENFADPARSLARPSRIIIHEASRWKFQGLCFFVLRFVPSLLPIAFRSFTPISSDSDGEAFRRGKPRVKQHDRPGD